MDDNVTENKKFREGILDPTLQLKFKKLSLWAWEKDGGMRSEAKTSQNDI